MHLHTTVLLPVCLGNLWGFAMPAQINSLFADYLVMMCTEAFYRSDDSLFLLRWVKRSSLCRTALFMCMSATILHTNRRLKTSDVVWFIQTFRRRKSANGAANGSASKPLTNGWASTNGQSSTAHPASFSSPWFDRVLPVDGGRHVCDQHAGSCDEYVRQGVQNNVRLGVCIELMRFVIDNLMRLRRNPALLFGALGQIKLRVLGFFVGYTTVYRVSNAIVR